VRISVVIPAFNEEKLIATTLGNINAARAAFTALGWESELIVCDNNSTDRTAELSCAGGAKVVFESVNQISRARNRGAAAATGDWLIFVDADSYPSAELFAAVAGEIQKGDCLAGGCTVKLDGRYPVASCVTNGWNLLSRFMRWAAGSFLFCEAAAFRQLGGFSQELFASEEIDLSQRLKTLARQTGKRLVILHRTPLVTSARKMHLYTPWEHVRFLTKTVLLCGRTLKNRQECLTWYDGRR
jgi:glycosyltransferase involved in cell wall biosynthesis